jgi:hypothetical protein
VVHGALEADGPFGELRLVEMDVGAGEPSIPEAHIGACELCPGEPDVATLELGADKTEGSSDKPGRMERHVPAGDARSGEVGDVEHRPLEAEVVSGPGRGAARSEMVAHDPDSGPPDLAVASPMLRRVSRVVRQAQVGAEDVDAGLALILPVVGQPCHRVHPGQADGSRLVPELLGGGRVALRQLGCIGSVLGGLSEELLAEGVDAGEDSPSERGDRDGGLDDLQVGRS